MQVLFWGAGARVYVCGAYFQDFAGRVLVHATWGAGVGGLGRCVQWVWAHVCKIAGRVLGCMTVWGAGAGAVGGAEWLESSQRWTGPRSRVQSSTCLGSMF